MTRAINSNTNLLSIDITRMRTQMRKSPGAEKESRKEMRRPRVKMEEKNIFKNQ